ncbi:MAG: hypothetical protein AB1761_06645 [Pseudomonadota bacterium]
MRVSARRGLAAAALALAGCAGGPLPPDWQTNARSALERSTTAYLKGDSRVAAVEFERARGEVARTGRADLVVRVELVRCAARVASLEPEPCEGFERLRADAAAAERAYADYLAARPQPQDAALLPAPHRAVAASVGADGADAALRAIEDPLARLVAAGVLFRANRATPATIALAIDAASAQGWRRPLLAWLNVQLARAEKAGDRAEAERLRRRIALVQGGQ